LSSIRCKPPLFLEQQKNYYKYPASWYNTAFAFDPEDEHFIACALLTGLANQYSLQRLLDVGCGTGRAINYLSKSLPALKITALEPVQEMRNAAVSAGIPAELLLPGDATALPFEVNAFDCCSAFGVLHHVPKPRLAIREMFRVARRAVFISDHHVYGMGLHSRVASSNSLGIYAPVGSSIKCSLVARDFTTPHGTGCFIHSA